MRKPNCGVETEDVIFSIRDATQIMELILNFMTNSFHQLLQQKHVI